MIWVANVAGIVCTTYMTNGQPQKNTLLTGVGNNIARVKTAQHSGSCDILYTEFHSDSQLVG